MAEADDSANEEDASSGEGSGQSSDLIRHLEEVIYLGNRNISENPQEVDDAFERLLTLPTS